jgi:hypothetical protein
MEKIQIRDPGWKKVESGIQDGNMPDPQHRLDIYQYGEDSRVHPCLCSARNGVFCFVTVNYVESQSSLKVQLFIEINRFLKKIYQAGRGAA